MANEAATAPDEQKGLLGTIEKVGNKVPHPVMMFLYLIIGVIVLSHILYVLGVSVTEDIAVPVPVEAVGQYYEDTSVPGYTGPTQPYDEEFEIKTTTIPIRSLLTTEGIRFIFTSFVPNFSSFAVVGITFIVLVLEATRRTTGPIMPVVALFFIAYAMLGPYLPAPWTHRGYDLGRLITFIALLGAGVAEEAGLMNALIRKLVAVAPAWGLSFIIIFVGVLSSVASDAGYLILIPLAAAAFLSIGRHPLVGLAAAFAGVAAIFTVNLIPTPIDAMLTEITNESIALAGGAPLTIAANLFFSIGSAIILSIVAAVVTERIVAPRLGAYTGPAWGAGSSEAAKEEITPEAESRGLKFSLYAFLGVLVVILLLTLPPGSPLRRPDGQIGGNSPLMDSLLFVIMLFFLIAGIAFGKGAGTVKSSGDVIKAVTKTFASLAGLVFMLLMISQFIAFFNYSNLPSVIAVNLAEILERASIGALPLLILMTLVSISSCPALCPNGPSSRPSLCRSSFGWALRRNPFWPPTASAIRR